MKEKGFKQRVPPKFFVRWLRKIMKFLSATIKSKLEELIGNLMTDEDEE